MEQKPIIRAEINATWFPVADIVVPLYNKKSTVVRTIRSIKAQTLNNFRAWIVNNNSTDSPDEIVLAEIADDTRFSYINCTEQGVAHARNRGLSLGDAPFCCCVDSDDEVMPSYLEVCINALRLDPSLGIAYSKLMAIHPDGREVVSAWPDKYDFDATLRKRNQVPTAAVFRREAWKRAGGYRQRYAPRGAGSEDADLWLRMGLLGYGGILATTEPLFRYHLGGIVSGNPDYREVDWLNDKAFIANGELPFAATSTPANRMAHPVRQYDEPEVSVIIPVHRDHIDLVWDAADSVEAQTFRKWELILVADDHERKEQAKWQRLQDAFPFAKFQTTHLGYQGAGAARNLGAELAKAPLLLFLDADDWLVPTALAELMAAHKENPTAIIYSDYYGHAYIENSNWLRRLRAAQRLLDYNEKTLEAKVLYQGLEFDCPRAQAQPIAKQDPYIWNVVSSLVPRQYHVEIGGFDVAMESWEDWDYWVRLAKAGKCFHHLPKPLLEYRFYTGQRRSLANPFESGEGGRQLSAHLLEYMRHKYEGIENMPCSSCGGGRRSAPFPAPFVATTLNEGKMSNETADGMVLVELIDNNVGDHLIAFAGTSYNYRVHGDQFYMKREHAALDRRVRIVTDSPQKAQAGAQPLPPPPASNAPKQPASQVKKDFETMQALQEQPATVPPTIAPPVQPAPRLPNPGPPAYDFVKLWGINEERADTLRAMGVRTLDGLIMLGASKIAQLFALPEMTARRIVAEADKQKEADSKARVGKASTSKKAARKK